MKVKTSKGFTLAELLIVMAIITVLAAVAVPTFGKQLETARETGDIDLIRNAYTEALTIAILDGADGTLDAQNGAQSLANAFGSGTVTGASDTVTCVVTLDGTTKQTQAGWQYIEGKIMKTAVGSGENSADVIKGKTKATFKFKLSDDGVVTIDADTAIALS